VNDTGGRLTTQQQRETDYPVSAPELPTPAMSTQCPKPAPPTAIDIPSGPTSPASSPMPCRRQAASTSRSTWISPSCARTCASS